MKEANTDINDLDGLSGWLILVGVGIILTPIATILNAFPGYYEIFSKGYLEILLTHGSNIYDPVLASVLIGEMAINIILILTWGFIAYLFFTKKKVFKKWYIGILVFTVVFIFVDSWALAAYIPNRQLLNRDTISEFVQALVWALVWIPYTLKSERVKATFTR